VDVDGPLCTSQGEIAVGQKKRRKSKALADLTQERELDDALCAAIYEAVRRARRSGVFVAIRLPAEFLRKLVEFDQRRTRQILDN
jgi:hypothetical protein